MSCLYRPYTCIVGATWEGWPGVEAGGDHLLCEVRDGKDGIPTVFIRALDDAPDIVFYLHTGHLHESV
jgi:hypothetical protein